MNHMPVELTFDECVRALDAGTVGRVAMCLPSGPRIVPVNYAVQDDAVVIRTSPYSELGTYGVGALLAFEVDDFDVDLREGWSVVVHGRCERIDDFDEIARLQHGWDPDPWAGGVRSLYLRLPWTSLTGRRLGGSALAGSLPAGPHPRQPGPALRRVKRRACPGPRSSTR